MPLVEGKAKPSSSWDMLMAANAADDETEAAARRHREEAAAAARAAEQALVRRGELVAATLDSDVRTATRALLAGLPSHAEGSDGKARAAAAAELGEREQQQQALEAHLHDALLTFSRGALSAIPPLLDTADDLDDEAEAVRRLGALVRARKAAAANALSIQGLKRRRAQLLRLRDVVLGVECWRGKTAAVMDLVADRRYADAVRTLGVRRANADGVAFAGSGVFERLPGSPLSRQVSEMERHGSGALAEDLGVGPGGVVLDTAVGTAAVAQWAALTDPANPLLLTELRRALCSAIAGRRFMARLAGVVVEEPAAPTSAATPSTPTTSDSAQGSEDDSFDASLAWDTDSDGAPDAATLRAAEAAELAARAAAQKAADAARRQEAEQAERAEGAVLLDAVLAGITALRFEPSLVTAFAVECFTAVADEKLRVAANDSLGEARATWGDVFDTLRYFEFYGAVVAVLVALEELLLAAGALSRHARHRLETDEEPRGHEAILALDAAAADRASELLLAIARRLPVPSGAGNDGLDAVLRSWRAMYLFCDGCLAPCNAGAATSVRTALAAELQQRLQAFFTTGPQAEAGNVVVTGTFVPFAPSADDFPTLRRYTPRPVDPAVDPGDGPQPVMTGAAAQERWEPCVAEGEALSLLDRCPVFTFPSFFVCKAMMELAQLADAAPAAAADLLDLVDALAAQYLWFVATHFVASAVTVPLDEDQTLSSEQRGAAAIVHAAAAKLGTPAGFPEYAGAPCHAWKAAAGSPAHHYGAGERSTALSSLEPVMLCQQSCTAALAALVSCPEAALEHFSLSEHGAVMVRHAAFLGYRRLACFLQPIEDVALAVERHRWDGGKLQATEAGLPPSPFVAHVADATAQLQAKLGEMQRREEAPAVGLSRVLQNVAFNIALGTVDGVARIRRWSDAGRQQLLADVGHLSKIMRAACPLLPQRVLDYMARFVKAVAFGAELHALFTEWHALYTTKQLLAAADREGAARRKDWEAMLKQQQHEDRPPHSLLE